MNRGILLAWNRAPVPVPYPLLGRPTPIPTPYSLPQQDQFALDPFQQESRAGYLPQFTTSNGYFQYSTQGGNTIGVSGTANFGIGSERITSLPYLTIVHSMSRSVVNDVPATATLTGLGGGTPAQQTDPYANSTATGFTFNSAAFPIPSLGYTIGTAGATAFGIATNKNNSVAIVDPIHTASRSVM